MYSDWAPVTFGSYGAEFADIELIVPRRFKKQRRFSVGKALTKNEFLAAQGKRARQDKRGQEFEVLDMIADREAGLAEGASEDWERLVSEEKTGRLLSADVAAMVRGGNEEPVMPAANVLFEPGDEVFVTRFFPKSSSPHLLHLHASFPVTPQRISDASLAHL